MTNKILTPARDSFKVGDRVRVFDRYLLALPCNGTVHKTEGVTEGCLVLLDKGSHGKADERFPNGIYVCFEQLRGIETMSEPMPPKIMSPAEALRELAAGKKLKAPAEHTRGGLYIHLADGHIRWDVGWMFEGSLDGFTEYTEPRPKRRIAPYLVRFKDGSCDWARGWYETDEEFRRCLPVMDGLAIERITELEREVE